MKKTKILYKNLKTAWGHAYINQNKIELYVNLRGKKHMEILLHEKLHIEFPDLDETAIKRISREITEVMWSDGYRKTKLIP